MKTRAILIASAVAMGACAGPHVPQGPPPEYEDLPAEEVPTATLPSANPESAAPPSARKAKDAATD
jgi:hypothetical protein